MKHLFLLVTSLFLLFSLTGCSIEGKDYFGSDSSVEKFMDPYANGEAYSLATYDSKEVEVAEIPTLDAYDTSGPTNYGVTSDENPDQSSIDTAITLESSAATVKDGNSAKDGNTTLKNRQRAAYSASQTEKNWLYACVFAEGGGEGKVGMTLIADVIISRALKYKASIKDVITSKNQFETYRNGSVAKYMRNGVSAECKEACNDALAGVDYSDGAMYFCTNSYYNSQSSSSWWKSKLKFLFSWKRSTFCK